MKLSKKLNIVVLIVSTLFIYCVIREISKATVLSGWCVVIPAILLLPEIIFALLRVRVSSQENRGKAYKRAVIRIYMTVMSFFIVLFLEELLMPQINQLEIFKDKVTADTGSIHANVVRTDDYLSSNEELLKGLYNDNYKQLSEQEKLDVLYQMVVVESQYLGITDIPDLQAMSLTDQNLGGYYSSNTNRITLNSDVLDVEAVTIKALLHELYHAYQQTCIHAIHTEGDLLFLRNVSQWREEFEENTPDPDEDFAGYYNMCSEQTARDYSDTRFSAYERTFDIVYGHYVGNVKDGYGIEESGEK